MAPVSEMLPAALQHWAGVLALVLAPLVLYQAYGWLNSSKKGPIFLDPSVFKELPLIDRKELSHNTRQFRCRLFPPPTLQPAAPVAHSCITRTFVCF